MKQVYHRSNVNSHDNDLRCVETDKFSDNCVSKTPNADSNENENVLTPNVVRRSTRNEQRNSSAAPC